MDVGNNDFRFTKLQADHSEEKEGKPMREPARAELHIDSLDRYNVNSPGMPAVVRTQQLAKLVGPVTSSLTGNNFTISGIRGRNLIYGYFERIALTQIQFFYRCPTVVSYAGAGGTNFSNNILYYAYYQVSTGTTTLTSITIPQGNYTPQGLALQVQTLIRAGALTPTAFTVTFSPSGVVGGLAGQFVFSTNVAGDTFALQFPVTIGGGSEILATIGFRTAKLFGFGDEAYIAGVGGSGTVIGRTPNLLYTDYVDICSRALTKFKRVKDTNSTDLATQDVIARIYLTSANTSTDPATNSSTAALSATGGTAPASVPMTFLPIINTSWITPNFNKWSVEETLSSIDFQLYDMYGNPLYWNADWNTEFQATLTVSET